MGWRDIVEIFFSYLQYIVLIISIAPSPYPQFYRTPLAWLKFLTLTVQDVFTERNRGGFLRNAPAFFPLDIRLAFILISIGMPTLVAFIALVALGSKKFLVFYFFVLVGSALFFVCVLAFASADTNLDSELPNTLRFQAGIAGTIILVLAVLAWGVYRLYTKQQQKVAEQHKERELHQLRLRRLREVRRTWRKQGGIAAVGTKQNAAEAALMAQLKKEHKIEDSNEAVFTDLMKEEIEKINVSKQVERFIFFVLMMFAGLWFARLFTLPGIDISNAEMDEFLLAVGIFFILAALFFLLSFMIGFSERGREMQFNVSTFMRDNFVSALLLVVSVLYVPAVQYIVNILNCNTFECPAFSKLPFERSLVTHSHYPTLHYNSTMGNGSSAPFSLAFPSFSAIVQNSMLQVADWQALIPKLSEGECNLCDFSQFSQRCSIVTQAKMCGGISFGDRIEYERTIVCAEMTRYFWPASALMFLSFVISMPVVNYILTSRSIEILEDEFPVDHRQTQGYTEEEVFNEKVVASDNVAKFIYDPFQRRYIHWRMGFLFQKLAVVLVSVFVIRTDGVSTSTIGISANLGIHLLMLAYMLITSPFNRKLENFLSNATQVILSIGCLFGLFGTVDLNSPLSIFIIIAVLAALSPILSLAIGAVLTFNDDLKNEQLREDRIMKAQEAAGEGYMEKDVEGEGVAACQEKLKNQRLTTAVGGKRPSATTCEAVVKKQHTTGDQQLQLSSVPSWIKDEASNVFSPPNPSQQLSAQFSPILDENAEQKEPAVLDKAALATGEEIENGKPEQPVNSQASPIFSPSPKKRNLLLPNLWKQPNDAMSPLQISALRASKNLVTEAKKRMKQAAEVMQEEDTPNKPLVLKSIKYVGFLDRQKHSEPPISVQANEDKESGSGNLLKGSNDLDPSMAPICMTERQKRLRRTGSIFRTDVCYREPKSGSSSAAAANNEAKKKNVWQRVKAGILKKAREEKGEEDDFDVGTVEAYHLPGDVGQKPKPKKVGRFRNPGMMQWDKLLEQLKSEQIRKNVRLQEGRNVNGDASVRGGNIEDNSVNSASALQGSASAAGEEGGQAAISNRRVEQQLRNRLRQMYEDHLAKIRYMQQAVDFKINVDTIGVLRAFFFVTSILSILALVWCVLGLMAREGASKKERDFIFVTRRTTFPENKFYALAGYNNWTEFTQQCCCSAFVNQSGYFPHFALDVERWHCANGKVKERVRRQLFFDPLFGEVDVNGYGMRPLCGMYMLSGCRIEQSTLNNRTLTWNSSGVAAIQSQSDVVSQTSTSQTLLQGAKLVSCNWDQVVQAAVGLVRSSGIQTAYGRDRNRNVGLYVQVERLW